jgi:flagellar motility protein MotE (MotC chaperone)
MRVLPVVAGLLLASAVLRGTGLIGAGLAEAETPAGAGSADPAASGLVCEDSGASETMLAAFRAREERLLAREAAVEDRARALGVAEAEIEEKLAALAEAEQSLSALLDVAETAASDDLARLTAVYENMKPAQASAIFARMDPYLAAGFLGMMRPESAAAVMSGLDPAAAYAISALIAGRHMDVPTQ